MGRASGTQLADSAADLRAEHWRDGARNSMSRRTEFIPFTTGPLPHAERNEFRSTFAIQQLPFPLPALIAILFFYT